EVGFCRVAELIGRDHQRVVVEADLRLVTQAVTGARTAQRGVELVGRDPMTVHDEHVNSGVVEVRRRSGSDREPDLGEVETLGGWVIQAADIAAGERVLPQRGSGLERAQRLAAWGGLL